MPDESRPFGELDGMRLVVGELDRAQARTPPPVLRHEERRERGDLRRLEHDAEARFVLVGADVALVERASESLATTFIHDKDDSTRASH